MARESKGALDIETINSIDKSDKIETIEKTWLMNMMDNPFWNLFLLALAWAMTLTTSTLLISIGPLVAHDELGADDIISAFTMGAFLIGASISSLPSDKIFRTYGRFFGFALGCYLQLVGGVLGGIAVIAKELVLLYFGCFVIGLAQGFGQFYRFTAVEVSPPHLKSRAITYVLSGGVLAAFLGPTCANYSMDMLPVKYLGCFFIVSIVACLNLLVIWYVKFPMRKVQNETSESATASTKTTPEQQKSALNDDNNVPKSTPNPLHSSDPENKDTSSSNTPVDISKQSKAPVTKELKVRPVKEIVSQPKFMVACTIQTLAHTIMIMVMSNVAIAMSNDGFDFQSTSLVMELHFFGMYGPGFFTGTLIARYGSLAVAFLGAFVFGSSSFVLASGGEFWNYSFGMFLSGFGWNFAFSSGTVMLTKCYEPIEATAVQGINDFILFSISGTSSLISGIFFSQLGWEELIIIVSCLMVVNLVLFFFMSKYAPKEQQDDDDAELIEDAGYTDDDREDSFGYFDDGSKNDRSSSHNRSSNDNNSYKRDSEDMYSLYIASPVPRKSTRSVDEIRLRASYG